MTAEIPGAPISRHDIKTIGLEIAVSRRNGSVPKEIMVSSRRLTVDGLKVFGVPVRRNDKLPLNEAMLIRADRPPTYFNLEEAPPSAHIC